MYNFYCPQCNGEMQYEEDVKGYKVECPHCLNKFIVEEIFVLQQHAEPLVAPQNDESSTNMDLLMDDNISKPKQRRPTPPPRHKTPTVKMDLLMDDNISKPKQRRPTPPPRHKTPTVKEDFVQQHTEPIVTPQKKQKSNIGALLFSVIVLGAAGFFAYYTLNKKNNTPKAHLPPIEASTETTDNTQETKTKKRLYFQRRHHAY